MFKLTVRHLLQKKIRFALTMLSVVLGVMFVVAAFVVTDSLRSTFSDLAEDITSGTDLTVRAYQEIGSDFDRPAIPDSVLDTVESVDGVAVTYPGIAAVNVVIVDGAGEAILPPGPPTLGFNFVPNQFFVTEGRAPDGPGEFVTDTTTANNNDLLIGDSYAVNGPIMSQQFELVGVFNFGSPDSNSSVGQTMAAFDLRTAQRFLGFDGELLEVGVVLDSGADPVSVTTRLEAALGASYEVITQEAATEEQQENFNDVINIFSTVLLVFAFVAVFVSMFIINNTFQIILGQRVREIGLWRAVGATPRQVTYSVVSESAILGVLSTVIGIGLGVALSIGLRAILRVAGFGLPSGPLELRPRTVLLAVVVGLGVTMASSLGPALRAQRVSPVASLSHDFSVSRTGLRRRLIGGGVVTGVGVVSLLIGMFFGVGGTAPTLVIIGTGALLTFIGINILSPAFARPVAAILGRPVLALLRVPGRIARDNAVRRPRRTASTASALMIGLALVGLTAVVGASMKKTFVRILDNAVEADYFLLPAQRGFNPSAAFPAQVADDIGALDELDSVVRYRFGLGSVQVNESTKDILAVEFATVESHLDGDIRSGDLATADPLTSVGLHVDPAEDLGVGVGDTLEMTFPDGETDTLMVAAIYADSAIYGNWVIDVALWEEHIIRNDLAFVSATISGFSDDLSEAEQTMLLDRSRAAIDRVLENYPTVNAENRVEFRQSQQAQLDSFLIVITVFLGLSLLIALVGIANTLALSVFERTKEIGLLRAVGMTRRQLRRAIRWEAAIVAVFGALLGVVVGTALGVAATVAIPDAFVSDVAVPVRTLIVYVVIAAVAGLVAAIGPARRAGRMNVLEAISYE